MSKTPDIAAPPMALTMGEPAGIAVRRRSVA